MTDHPPNYSNGIRQGRTEATLEGLANALDEVKAQIGLNCPIGKENRERIHDIESSKGKWFDTLIAIIITAIATASVAKLI